MSRPTSSQALASEAVAPRLKPAASAQGDSASSASVTRLQGAVADLKAQAVRPLLDQTVAFLKAQDFAAGSEWALKALHIDEKCGLAWWMLAICREQAGDPRTAIACYESALKLLPDHAEIAHDLGRLAYSLGQKEVAEQLFSHFLLRHPGHPEAANNLACALRDQQRFDEAVETLRTVIYAHSDQPMLWNTLGTVLNEQGEIAEALTFYDEALRLDSGFARARYNRANARLSIGEVRSALSDVDQAIADNASPLDRPMMALARALALIASGQLKAGWDEYEVRFDPGFADSTRYLLDMPRWTPDADLTGRTLLVIGEQGLGDEVLFANVLPDVMEALGAGGRLVLAVEPRLVALFARSFPRAEVGAHATFCSDGRTWRTAPFLDGRTDIDLWTPLASLNRRFRGGVEAFPPRASFLRADPGRVAYWRTQLAALGAPTVGIVWKSFRIDSARRRFFSPFEQWRPVLAVEGAAFVNLQYGDCSAELEQAREAGLQIWTPPGIDLKDDLDDVAALATALDLVIGPPNATTNIAAACGARTWLISTPGAWPRLGTDRYPWYPTVEAFTPETLNAWGPVMNEIADALARAF